MIELITSLLTILTIALAPVLLIYALVVWHAKHDSKAAPIMILLSILLAVRAITDSSCNLFGANISKFFGALSLTLAMILLFFSLRSYVHASIKQKHTQKK